jgi:hypothetical protein
MTEVDIDHFALRCAACFLLSCRQNLPSEVVDVLRGIGLMPMSVLVEEMTVLP